MATGNHYSRVYISPDTIADLIQVPEGVTVKAVNWQNDRQAFILVLEMPVAEEFFVESNALIPELALVQSTFTDDNGGRHIRFSWPEPTRSTHAADDRQPRTRRKKTQKALAAA